MITNETNNLVLRVDFAERVLERADLLIARRTLIGRAIAGVAVPAFASVAILSWMAMHDVPQPPHRRAASDQVALADAPADIQSDETDALDDLFPDAAPVARFAAQYSDAAEVPDSALLSDQDPSS
jgi:hypothetical protein